MQLPQGVDSPAHQQHHCQIARRRQQPAVAALHHLAEDMQLHGNEIFRLILFPQEGFVKFQDQTLDGIGAAPQQQQLGRLAEVEAADPPDHRPEQSADNRAAEILRKGETLVGRIFIHAPGGRMQTRCQPGDECDDEMHWIHDLIIPPNDILVDFFCEWVDG